MAVPRVAKENITAAMVQAKYRETSIGPKAVVFVFGYRTEAITHSQIPCKEQEADLAKDALTSDLRIISKVTEKTHAQIE